MSEFTNRWSPDGVFSLGESLRRALFAATAGIEEQKVVDGEVVEADVWLDAGDDEVQHGGLGEAVGVVHLRERHPQSEP